MVTLVLRPLAIASLFALVSCTPPSAQLTDVQRAAVADSAKALTQRILDNSNQLKFDAAFADYSADADARYVENGVLYPSLDALKKAYAELAPMLELVANSVDSWEITVLAPDAALVTVPIHLRIKAKNRPEVAGQYVWSAVVQRRAGKWQAIQTHESQQNPETLMAALLGPPTPTK